MLDIIQTLIKETINEYIIHKMNTIYDIQSYIYILNHTFETSFYEFKLDSLLSFDLFPYYLLYIKNIDIEQVVKQIPSYELDLIHSSIINSYFFDKDIDLENPYTLLGYYYIYYINKYRNIIQHKLLNILTTYHFHF